MKAISPALPLRRNHLVSYSQDLGISPVKSVWDEPLGVLCEMNGCYSRLKELVPSLPQDRSVSNMEILQHVIDYILDLQLALDSSSTDPIPPPQRHPRSGSPGSPDTSSSSTDDTSSFSPLSNFSRVTTTDEHPRISR